MTGSWRVWAPAALTIAGLCLGMAASIQEVRLQRLAHGDAAAFVNGQPIMSDDVERALASMGADRRAALTQADRRKVLERLIEDELLAQRAVALGLPVSDPNARKVLIRGLIDSLVATAPAPTGDELRRYYNANPGLFREADLISVAPEGGPVRGLPATPMTIDKLKDYLGGGAEALAAVPVGGTAGPFSFAGQSFRVRVTARIGGGSPPFDQARDAVLTQYIAVRDGQRLRSYIDSLKRTAKIERVE
jgi:hypothetical protein